MGEIYGLPPERRWGTGAKVAKLNEFEQESGIDDQDFCYAGDEMIDLGVMRRVGFPVSPANGAAEAREAASFITQADGGQGVVRELAEFILKAQGKWETVIEKLSA